MSKKPKEYVALPGRGTRVSGLFSFSRSRCRLWLGSDHLLLVDRIGYTETYKRFYFRDIQAVLARRTSRGKAWNWVLLLLTLVCAGLMAAVANRPGRISWGIGAGFFALFLLINLVRGPTCIAHIKTAVQMECLPAWNRMWVWRRGMKRLRPHILEAQEKLSAEDLAFRLEENMRGNTAGPSASLT